VTDTMTLQHRWVKHTITPISVLPDPDDDRQVVAIEDPKDVELAEEQSVYGCDICGVSMPGNTDTTCPGFSDDEIPTR